MIGSWRWNAIAAGAVAGVIFMLSVRNNPLETASVRTGIAFAVTFAVVFAVRWLLGLATIVEVVSDSVSESDAEPDDAGKGQTIDIVTPDDPDEEDAEPSFTPLAPPKLAKTETPIDPELLAKALRHMSEK